MVAILSQLSDDLAQIVDEANPAVVQVDARRRLPASGIVWDPDGIVVAAHHSLEREDNIDVGLNDRQKLSATLVGRDPATDIAVLRVKAESLASSRISDLGGLRVGHLVLALGRPGRTVLATLGIVSALGEAWRSPAGGRMDRYLQTDVVMYPGFSGGPLVDIKGHVIGLNTSAVLRGISLTVPASTINRVVEELLTHGRIRRGYLGIGAQPVRLPKEASQGAGQETGLLLVSVEADSPAEKGGLMLGDTIVAVNDHPTRQLDDLLGLLGADKVGVSLPVRVVRGGKLQDLTVTVGERT